SVGSARQGWRNPITTRNRDKPPDESENRTTRLAADVDFETRDRKCVAVVAPGARVSRSDSGVAKTDLDSRRRGSFEHGIFGPGDYRASCQAWNISTSQ